VLLGPVDAASRSCLPTRQVAGHMSYAAATRQLQGPAGHLPTVGHWADGTRTSLTKHTICARHTLSGGCRAHHAVMETVLMGLHAARASQAVIVAAGAAADGAQKVLPCT
jgi:hypothetical protein